MLPRDGKMFQADRNMLPFDGMMLQAERKMLPPRSIIFTEDSMELADNLIFTRKAVREVATRCLPPQMRANGWRLG